MHLYTADELQALFVECEMLEVAGFNVTVFEFSPAFEEVAADSQAWATAVELEHRLNTDPGLLNSGSHIIMAVRR